MKTAVIILGHGSRREGAGGPLQGLAAAVRQRGGHAAVEHAFLQYATPMFPEAVDRIVAAGAERVVIVPFFVQPGHHVTGDITGHDGTGSHEGPFAYADPGKDRCVCSDGSTGFDNRPHE